MAEYFHDPNKPQYLQQQHTVPHGVPLQPIYQANPVTYGVHPQPAYQAHPAPYGFHPQSTYQSHPVPYGVHLQPTYQAHHLQGPWGQDQVGQQYAYSGSPQPPSQTSWTPSPPVHSPPQQSRDPEHELASVDYQAPSYKTGITEEEKREKFKPSPKYNDLWAMFAFLLQMVAFIVLSAFAINNIIKTAVITSADKSTDEKDFFLTTNVMVSFALGIGISVVYSYIYLLVTNA
ncbi:hypothetical protein BGZ83_003644 [Gryganskiella cystojenkinii]|nr:hypothetical protein BGZ83_003644 [Gryganskiella cystojenkinii]